jgi:chromosome segregation ATPase
MCVAAVALGLWGDLLAAERLDEARAAIVRLVEKDRSVAARAGQIEPHARALGDRISALKAKGSAGRTLIEDAELAGLLRSSLDISRQQDALADEEDAIRTDLKNALEKGLAAARAAAATDKNAAELARDWEKQLAEIAGAKKAVRRIDIKVTAIDGPAELREKADLLKDTEDRLRREIASMRARLKDVNEERALRSEASDFVKEHFVFEEEDSKRGFSRTYEKQSPQSASDTSGGSRGTTKTGTAATAPPSGGGTATKTGDKESFGTPAVGGAEGAAPGGAYDSISTGGGSRGAVESPAFSAPTTAAPGAGMTRTSVTGIAASAFKNPRGADFADPADEASWLEAQIEDLEREANGLSEKSDALRKMADELRRELKKR